MTNIFGSENIILPDDIYIPTITDERLEEIYKNLKPLISIDKIKYLLKEYTLYELRYLTFIDKFSSIRSEIQVSTLEETGEFLCFHKFYYYGVFLPKVSEVLAQIPDSLIDESNYFEIVEYPKSMSDVFKYDKVFEKGYHLSRVKTYKTKLD